MLIGLLLSTQAAVSTYQVTAGQTFDFDVIKAEMAVTVGSNSGSGQGFTLDGHHFEPGTQVTVTVDAVDPDPMIGVDWTVSANGYSEQG